VPYYIVLAAIAFFIKKKEKLNFDGIQRNYAIAYAFAMILIIFSIMLSQLFLFENFANLGTKTLLLVNTCLYGITFFGLLYGGLKYTQKNSELEYQKFYNSNLAYLLDELRVYKHGNDNFIASLVGYVEQEDYAALKTYLEEYANTNLNIKFLSNDMLRRIKNAGVFGVLLHKMTIMNEKQIEYKLTVNGAFENININMRDFCEGLGILLDNAIEAAAESEEKTIKIVFTNDERNLSVEIENSVKEKPDLSKMFHKGWSSRGEGRGIGLWRLKQIIDKYLNAGLNTEYYNHYLRQTLMIGK
jgi:two-component system sensor histidine kinase AgrC